MEAKDRLIVALDYPSLEASGALISELGDQVGAYKVGLELASGSGWPAVIDFVHERQSRVFADAKIKDIPNTVTKTVRQIASSQPDMLNMYADSGVEAMQQAVKEAEHAGTTKMLGVTVLTAMSPEECQRVYGEAVPAKVLDLGKMAVEGGLDGLICSPQDLDMLHSDPDTAGLLKVTPGVRPSWAQSNDQKRTMTPRQAVEAGADHLVIGRPITQPPESIGTSTAAVEAIIEEINQPA